jgi:hypothetical protein
MKHKEIETGKKSTNSLPPLDLDHPSHIKLDEQRIRKDISESLYMDSEEILNIDSPDWRKEYLDLLTKPTNLKGFM